MIRSVSSAPSAPPKINTPGHQPCVFLDRDGVLNTTDGFVNSPEDMDNQLIPESVEALARLAQRTSASIVLVTNQGGVGYGKMSAPQVESILERLSERIEAAGGRFDAIYYCPNRKDEQPPEGHITARKPSPGMFYQAASDFGDEIDLADSYMIGDMTTDIAAGEAATPLMTSILVETGFGGEDGKVDIQADQRFENLSEAVDWIIERESSPVGV